MSVIASYYPSGAHSYPDEYSESELQEYDIEEDYSFDEEYGFEEDVDPSNDDPLWFLSPEERLALYISDKEAEEHENKLLEDIDISEEASMKDSIEREVTSPTTETAHDITNIKSNTENEAPANKILRLCNEVRREIDRTQLSSVLTSLQTLISEIDKTALAIAASPAVSIPHSSPDSQPVPIPQEIASLILVGELLPGDSIEATFKTQTYKAEIAPQGSILYKGKYYPTPSAAFKAASNGTSNGWDRWIVVRTGKSLKQIFKEANKNGQKKSVPETSK